MNWGKKFEENFIKSIDKEKFFVYRVPDPPQAFSYKPSGDEENGYKNILRFSNKNPYDFQIFCKPYLLCLELKSISTTSISFERFKNENKSARIHFHQIEGLVKAASHKGIIGGFILNFRNTNNTYFLDIKHFVKWLSTTALTLNKKSINENDIKSIGGLKIEQTLLRSNYRFGFEEFYKELVGEINA